MTMSDDNLMISDDAPEESADAADAQLIDLVAYLDGELDDVSVDAIERRLTVEAPLRQQAEQLDKTWQLLDALEEVTASGEFTHKTLASMAATSVTTPSADDPIVRRTTVPWKKSVVCYGLSLAVSALGIFAAQWRLERNRPAADVELLRNLELLENYNRYDVVRSLSALKRIAVEASAVSDPQPTEKNSGP